jgi:folate-binding protein YgfZ
MGKTVTGSSGGKVVASLAYQAATQGAAALRRKDRRFVSVQGRAPGQMLNGILSGRMPPEMRASEGGWSEGEAPYSTVLTPKGKMVTDLRLLPFEGGGFLLDLPLAGLGGALQHFEKFLNPHFAQLADRSDELEMLTVLGPEGPELVSRVMGLQLPAPGEGRVFFHPGSSGPGLRVLGNSETQAPAVDLLLPKEAMEGVWEQLEDSGILPMDTTSWEVLRIERGTPLFGVDMTEETIPVEAGIHGRAIDYQKGCYIGQEVIVRIRDRGKVNKSLRRILLGEVEVPPGGTDLYLPEDRPLPAKDAAVDPHSQGDGLPGEPAPTGSGKKAGWVTSACRSPRFGQTVALGFIRREVGGDDEVRLGGPHGPPGRVETLSLDDQAGP